MLRGLCASCEKYRNPTWKGRHFFICVLVTCIFSLKLSTLFAYTLLGLWWLSRWLLWVISTFALLSAHPALFQPPKAAVSGPEADDWQDFRSVDSPHSSRPTKSHTPFSLLWQVVFTFNLKSSHSSGELMFMERYQEVIQELARVEHKIENQNSDGGSSTIRRTGSGRSTLQAIGSAAAAGSASLLSGAEGVVGGGCGRETTQTRGSPWRW